MITATVTPPNLLIVDDEPAQLQTLSDIFADDGFVVCGCSSIEEALDQCRRQSFTVAILDLRLHGQDGIELLKQVRQAQPGIRVIVHTAYGSFDSAKDAVNMGAFAYLEKRGNPAELVDKVHRATEDRLSEALSQSEQRFRDLLDDVDAIVWECELPSWRFTFVSQHAESILGYAVSQWLEETDFWVNHVHAEDRERVVKLREKCTSSGEDHDFDYRAIAADGRVVWLRDLVRVVKDDSGAPVQMRGVMLDITAKKLAEEQLQDMETQLAHVSRLSTMGEMVAGIAHEINQPLAAIANYAVACESTIANLDDETELPIATWLREIREEAVRSGEIIRRLRSFVNKGDRQWKRLDFNQTVRESVLLISSELRARSVSIDCCLPEQSPRVCGSQVQLQQVLVNLMRNACDATCTRDCPEVRIRVIVRDQNAELTVEDNGVGVEKEQQTRLFDAFYTTKPDGMGMGLAISKSIIEAHHGTLRFDPETSSGARFHVDLPLNGCTIIGDSP